MNFVADSRGTVFEVLDVTDDDHLVLAVAAWTAVVSPVGYRQATPAECAQAASVAPLTARLRSLSPRFPVGRNVRHAV